jgi:glycoside hydrolase-like protein
MRRTALLALFAVTSCVRGGMEVNAPRTVPGVKPRINGSGSPGFDKRDFPGLSQMNIWWATSPYEWVGYYLPSPCYSGAAWTGNRQQLIDQGWGLALLYVGLQAPRATARAGDSTTVLAAATRCSTNTLSAEQGRADADDAVNVAAADGFGEGTTIFLDVERADPFPPALDEYMRAWVKRVLERRFTPGIYAHRLNADALFNSAAGVYRSAGDTRQPPFWVSNSQGFDLTKSPGDSGFPFATMWQNPSDANETYGGVTFRIDSNVATKKNPSQP